MANRNFHRMQSLSRETKVLYGRVQIGASGAPTLVASDSIGIESITRDSAGVYEVVLQDKYNKFLGLSITHLEATAEDLTFQLEEESVSSDKTFKFQCKAAAVDTDPSDGSELLLRIDLKNTSVSF